MGTLLISKVREEFVEEYQCWAASDAVRVIWAVCWTAKWVAANQACACAPGVLCIGPRKVLVHLGQAC